MKRIQVGSWKTHSSLDGAEFIDGEGIIIAVVAEPWRRYWWGRGGDPREWSAALEMRWRELCAVRACREFRATRYVQFDPGRDNAFDLDLDTRPWALQ